MSELQHPESRAFELVADVYERVRPEYPRPAVKWLAEKLDLRPGRTVLDLGAGTGKLTRSLVTFGARVIAVEPGDAMRAELERAVPGIEALRGSAEQLPLPDAGVDAVAIGQAFHWFRHEEAIPELHRVLRPHGHVALLWNSRDQDDPLQREISDLIAPFATRRATVRDSSRYLPASGLFGPFEQKQFRFADRLDADSLVDRVLSISFIAARPAERRNALATDLRDLVMRYGGEIDFPYVTDVYVSQRRARSATSSPPSSS